MPHDMLARMATKGKATKQAATDSQYHALAEFRYHIRRYLDFSDQAARSAGLEPKQYQLLLALKGLPVGLLPTVTALAQQLGTRHHSTVELVNRAERNGLVRRTRSGNYVHVQLTRKGESTLARVVEERLQELRVAGPVLVKALQQLITNDRPSAKNRK
jgi:DNA-binding MarR family transcriptional regulator